MTDRPRRSGARKSSINVRRIGVQERRRLALLHPYPEVERPRTRGDCLLDGINSERPCPFVSCRYHLALDVRSNGSVTVNFPDPELEQLDDSCALDVADRGGMTLIEVGARMNLTRERVRQIEARALLTLPDDALIALQGCR